MLGMHVYDEKVYTTKIFKLNGNSIAVSRHRYLLPDKRKYSFSDPISRIELQKFK